MRTNTKLSYSFYNENLASLNSMAFPHFFGGHCGALWYMLTLLTLCLLSLMTVCSWHCITTALRQHTLSPSKHECFLPSYSSFLYQYISAMKRQKYCGRKVYHDHFLGSFFKVTRKNLSQNLDTYCHQKLWEKCQGRYFCTYWRLQFLLF